MKLFVVTLFVGLSAAAKLSNNYLPPSSAASAGGHGNFLQGPAGPSRNYLAPKPSAFNQGGAAQGGYSGGAGYAGQAGGAGYAGQAGGAGYAGQAGGAFGGQGAGFGKQGGGIGGGYSGGPQIPILSYNNVNNGDGSYHFDYATGNGIQQTEDGRLNNAEQAVQGSYSYTGDDGQTYTVQYKADANGFQPIGDHLPTPPPIPEAILRSLEYNAAHPEENNAGAYDQAAHGGAGGSYGGNQGGSAFAGQGGFAGGSGAGYAGAGAGRGSFGARPQQNYLPPQQQQQHHSGGAGGAAGYQY